VPDPWFRTSLVKAKVSVSVAGSTADFHFIVHRIFFSLAKFDTEQYDWGDQESYWTLVHTPFAFQPGDEQDPRDQNGNVLYDRGVTLLDTWRAMESLVDHGRCRAIGLSDISLNELLPIYESARIKPAVVQVEAHPYLPETELLEFCKEKGVVFLAFAALGHGMRPGPLEDPVISAIAARVGKTPAQVLLAWAVQRGTALLTTPRTAARARENLNISALPKDALDEINRIQTRQRFNEVVKTGIPGFIPQGS
jgi:alcohol dehydrogenase (NADP+)